MELTINSFEKTPEYHTSFECKCPELIYKVANKAKKIFLEGVTYAATGYAWYWAAHLVSKIPFLNFMNPPQLPPIAGVMYGLSLPCGKVMIHALSRIGLWIIGDRPLKESKPGFLREKTWKIIDAVEKLPCKIDLLFSKTIFHIRTETSIKENKISNSDLSWPEIVRRCLFVQISNFLKYGIPLIVGAYAIRKMGMPVLWATVSGECSTHATWFLITVLFYKCVTIVDRLLKSYNLKNEYVKAFLNWISSWPQFRAFQNQH